MSTQESIIKQIGEKSHHYALSNDRRGFELYLKRLIGQYFGKNEEAHKTALDALMLWYSETDQLEKAFKIGSILEKSEEGQKRLTTASEAVKKLHSDDFPQVMEGYNTLKKIISRKS